MKKYLLFTLAISFNICFAETPSYELELSKIYHEKFVKPMEKKVVLIVKKIKLLHKKGDKLSTKQKKESEELILQLKRFKFSSEYAKIGQEIHSVIQQQNKDPNAYSKLKSLSRKSLRLFSEYSEIAREKEFMEARQEAQKVYMEKKIKFDELQSDS